MGLWHEININWHFGRSSLQPTPFLAIHFHPSVTLCTVLEQEFLHHPCHEKNQEETFYLFAGLFFLQIYFSVPLKKQQHKMLVLHSIEMAWDRSEQV